MIGSTMFPHKQVHKCTWRSPDRRSVNQIDHIAISRRDRSFFMDMRSFRGADIGLTDHYLVEARVRMKLRKEMHTEQPRRFDVQKLKCQQTCDEFRETLENKLPPVPSNDAETEWNAWKTAMLETVAAVLDHARRH